MNNRPTREERESWIAGGRASALADDDRAELALLADLLAHPSTWAEPNAGLEDSVVQAVLAAAPASAAPGPHNGAAPAARPIRRRRPVLLAALGAAAAFAAVIGMVSATRSRSADFAVRLEATALAPGARASATGTENAAGYRIVLDARGLPALAPGEYYEAWLENATGTLVPIGTFSSSAGK
ncbi:MAG TPA: anti-sigma factor, partial [Acidimicrobiia bacterium]|nr:anti-sigma factor [Acidimicrobiia bacterium]